MSFFNTSTAAPAPTAPAATANPSPFGAFGQQQQNQQQQQQQQQQPAAGTTSAFGGGQSTNLFGTNTANNTLTASNPSQQQPPTGLFGQSTTGTIGAQPQQQQQQQQPTGLFGQSKPLFGSTPTTNATPATTNLFGSNPSSQPSLFGNNTQNQPGQQPASNAFQLGGFGASTTGQQQQNTNPTPSLFGQPATQQPAAPSLFGQSTAAPAPSLFGQSQSQPLQQSTLSHTNTPIFTRSTKFNDLPEDVRKKFEQLDSHIQGRVQISNELKQHKLGEEPQRGSEQIRIVHKDLVNSINKLRTDIASMRELKARMDQAVQDTIAATRIIEVFKNPQNAHTHVQQSSSLKNHAGFPLEFFTRVTEQLRERLTWVNNTLEQIERKLASEVNQISVTPQSITSTLQAQHASFVALASKTAALDAELQKLKNTYRTLWRARTGSARDPFDERDRRGVLGDDNGEFGLEGLNVSVS